VSDRLFDVGSAVDTAALEQIRLEGKAKQKAQAIAIAHGLAFDPHVDGRLRLTPAGREKLEGVGSSPC
jgi:hypothetical protein